MFRQRFSLGACPSLMHYWPVKFLWSDPYTTGKLQTNTWPFSNVTTLLLYLIISFRVQVLTGSSPNTLSKGGNLTTWLARQCIRVDVNCLALLVLVILGAPSTSDQHECEWKLWFYVLPADSFLPTSQRDTHLLPATTTAWCFVDISCELTMVSLDAEGGAKERSPLHTTVDETVKDCQWRLQLLIRTYC